MNEIKTHGSNSQSNDGGATKTLLIIDDDPTWVLLNKALLERDIGSENIFIISCLSIEEAQKILCSRVVHAVLLDKDLGSATETASDDGVYAIPKLLEIQDHLQIVMSTSSEETQDVVLAMRHGASAYTVKGKNYELFVEQVKRALRDGFLAFKNQAEKENYGRRRITDLGGSSLAIQQLRARIQAVSRADAPVLFLGDTGTGKTTAAKLLHELKLQYLRKSNSPFVSLNMAAIPENLAENELFGSEAGAFTDAKKLKTGAFDQANGGTLFLDEIGEASLALQAKLLTVLDSGTFKRVGGTIDIISKFRLVCATNRNLEDLIKEKKFREDLYRRISIIEIKVPTISERAEDIPDLIKSLLPACVKDAGVHVAYEDLPKAFIEYLVKNPPSGNIRGLGSQLTRLLVNANRDNRGRPILSQWSSIQGIVQTSGKGRNNSAAISVLSDNINLITDSNFKDANDFIRKIEKKIYLEAKTIAGTGWGSNRRMSKILGVSDQQVALKLRAHNQLNETELGEGRAVN